MIKVKSGEWVSDSIVINIDFDGVDTKVTYGDGRDNSEAETDAGGQGKLGLKAEIHTDGDSIWIGISNEECGCFIPVLIQKLEETILPPWERGYPGPGDWKTYISVGGVCHIKASLLSDTAEVYWGKKGGCMLRCFFKKTPELTTCAVSLDTVRETLLLDGRHDFPILEFTDSELRYNGRTYRRFTPADLPKAQLMGSYERVFGIGASQSF